jgi:hypothetical protein
MYCQTFCISVYGIFFLYLALLPAVLYIYFFTLQPVLGGSGPFFWRELFKAMKSGTGFGVRKQNVKQKVQVFAVLVFLKAENFLFVS